MIEQTLIPATLGGGAVLLLTLPAFLSQRRQMRAARRHVRQTLESSGKTFDALRTASERGEILQGELRQLREAHDRQGRHLRTAIERNALLNQGRHALKRQLDQLKRQLDGLKRQLDEATADRYRAVTERDQAIAERDAALMHRGRIGLYRKPGGAARRVQGVGPGLAAGCVVVELVDIPGKTVFEAPLSAIRWEGEEDGADREDGEGGR